MVGAAQAAEIAGIRFDDKVILGKETLVLNGVGLRTATLFKVKVYGAALYLREKVSTEAEALGAPYPKQLQMEFVREVEGGDIGKAWDASFEENCETACERHKENIGKLKSLMVTVKPGDRMVYTFLERSVELAFNGAKKGELTGEGFPAVLLSTWIGKHPPTEALKMGLLGRADP